jgi:hypothetical protein
MRQTKVFPINIYKNARSRHYCGKRRNMTFKVSSITWFHTSYFSAFEHVVSGMAACGIYPFMIVFVVSFLRENSFINCGM